MSRQALVVLLTAASWISVDSIECASGYGLKVRVIPDSWINDGFCDCPLDALDEPGTDACAGAPVGGWAGVHGHAMDRSPTFSCPQQPKKKIPLSRVNDGICDCCDGADESADGVCKDICDQVLREEREARAKAESDYTVGSAKRTEELAAFQTLVKETLKEIETVEKDVKAKDLLLQANTKLMAEAKLAFVEQRKLELLKSIASSDSGASDLLDPLTNDEIVQLIQLTCQIAGEMEGSIKERTCVPLRLAGIDLGIVWKDEVFVNAFAELVDTSDEEGKSILAGLVMKNTQGGDKVWSVKQLDEDKGSKKNRRRLDDHYPDDDYDEEYGNDDYEYEETVGKHEENEPVEEANEEEQGEEGEEISKVKTAIESSPLSRPRKNFLAQSESLVTKIEEFLKIKDEEAKQEEEAEKEKENEAEGAESEGAENAEESPSFDPMAYNLAKTSLRRRQQAIKRGFQYAVSAKILLDAVTGQEDSQKVREDLISLAITNLWHSRASTEHVWRMLTTILPEYGSAEDAQTCASPLASICPAKTITRDGSEYPPAQYMKSAEAACERAVDEINAAGCSESATDEIVTHVPDGYYGYNEIKPRAEDDALEQLFSSVSELSPTKVNDFETKQQSLEQEVKSLESNVKSLEDKIGGRDVTDDGRAELHSMKDQCFIVTEGKYDYEVCIYGSSSQRDKGKSAGGTSLGNWQGMSFDEEAGHRVMKWERGQKCWNGPQRSATVIVKCGAETKLLSAEEPDTCMYVIEMESHIACDDDYYQKYLA